MSTHFTYEINEPNLRSKLKAISVPLNEDAWKWFDLQADLNVKPMHVNRLMKLREIHVDRKVLMPAAFGVVILLFALLLYNFISIKSPAQSAAKQEVSVPVPQIKANDFPAAPKEKPAVSLNEDLAIRVADIRISPESSAAPQSDFQSQHVNTAVAMNEPAMHVRKKRVAVPVVEPLVSDDLPVIAPTIATEPVEPDIKP